MYAQVEIVENFDNAPDFDVPTGWSQTEFFTVIPGLTCDASGKSALKGFEEFQLPAQATLTTPNYIGITNATDLTLSFTVNIYEAGPAFFFPQTFNAPVAGWGNFTVEYSLDSGSNWITAAVIDDSNFTYVSTQTCIDIPASNLGVLTAGNDFQARFVFNGENITPDAGNTLVVQLDNVSITQVATNIPNCDSVLLSPTNGSTGTDLNDTITWGAATGIPTGYNLSIGTTSGGTDIVNAATTSDTSFSLSGLGLAYDTEYFVNIVPFNSFGDATGCTEESFRTRLEPIQGATCANPFEITSFPFVGAPDDTGNYENNINEGPCGGFAQAFIDGFDVFYTITPTTDISIEITLASILGSGAAIHVFDNCPDVATECVAIASDNFTAFPPDTYDLVLEDLVLSAGTTYYIVLSSGGFDSTFSYQALLITQNSCINPEFTLTPVADCGNGQYSVDVDVTYLGDATSLTLSDGTNTITNITSTGIVNIGPYPSTTTVDLTLTNDQDSSCDFTDSTFFYCPPVNDDCSAAIDLTSTINTDGSCTLFTSATNAGATESVSNPVTCNFQNTNDVWFSFVASQETMILEYLNIVTVIGEFGTRQYTELLDGSCGTFTSLGCFNNFTNFVTFFNLTVGDTYYIRNSSDGTANIAQTYDICLREAAAPPTNDECSNASVLTLSTDDSCDNQITGTTIGASPSSENTCNNEFSEFWKDVWYEFTATETGLYEFTFNEPTFSGNYIIYSGTCGTLVEETNGCSTSAQVQSIMAGETRYIMVRSGDNNEGVSFDLCVFKLPPPAANDDCSTPTVLLESADATGNNAISGDFANVYPSPEACDIGGNTLWYSFTPNFTGTYNFNLTPTDFSVNYSVFNTSDCSQTNNNFVNNMSCYYGAGDLVTDLVAGNTYLIAIYTFNSNLNPFNLLVYPDASLSTESNTIEGFKYYPNPVNNVLKVEAKNTISNVSVYNIVGQRVQWVQPNNLKATIDMSELDSGIYFVTLTSGASQNTIKIVKK